MKKAFSLAEVLITLGIIGVVASLTIPALIQSHKKQVVETKLKMFYSVINQSVKMSEIDNGPIETWLWQKDDTENFYNTYLKNYLETLDIQEVSQNELKIFLKDGTAMVLANDIWANGGYIYFFINAFDCKKYNGDWNSIVNRDKLQGKRVFTFGFYPSIENPNFKKHYHKGIEPYKAFYGEECRRNPYTCGSNTHLNCNPDAGGEKRFCAAVIQDNNWKIPNNYPFRL